MPWSTLVHLAASGQEGSQMVSVEVARRLTSSIDIFRELQDGTSFRYGIVTLGGRDRTEVFQRFEACRAKLDIVLLPVGEDGDRESLTAAPMQAEPMTGLEFNLR
jgi:hypothetical protein